jgi:hypothetical protein
MPPDGIVLWAIIVAVFLATAIAAFAQIKGVLGGERPGSTGNGINTAAGGGQAAKTMERRRSERFTHRACVFAYSHAPGESPFHEEATTLEVSSHGGLLTLAANVSVGQKLLLTNIANQEERECYVVRFTCKHGQKRDVAIEFTRSAPDFWQTRTERPQEVF